MDVGYFSFSSKVDNLLFKGITVSTYGGMVSLCLGIAAFTFLYEGVKNFRHHLVILLIRARNQGIPISEDGSSQRLKFCCLNFPPIKPFERFQFHCFQTFLYMLQLTMGYLIMLIIMSYNAWFLITIILVTAVCFFFQEFVLSRKPLILPVEIPNSNL